MPLSETVTQTLGKTSRQCALHQDHGQQNPSS